MNESLYDLIYMNVICELAMQNAVFRAQSQNIRIQPWFAIRICLFRFFLDTLPKPVSCSTPSELVLARKISFLREEESTSPTNQVH